MSYPNNGQPYPAQNNPNQFPQQPYPYPVNQPYPNKPKGKGTKKFALTLLYISLGLSSLIAVAFFLFGQDDTYSGKAFSTIGLILLVDIFLMLALMSKIPAIKYTSWGITLTAFLFSCLGVWMPSGSDDYIGDIEPYIYPPYPEPERTIGDIFGDIGGGLWLLATSIVVVAAFSILYNLAAKINKLTQTLYWSLVGIAVLGTLPLSIAIATDKDIWENFPLEMKIYLSTVTLCITLAIILLIAMFNDLLSKKKNFSDMNQYPPNNPSYNYPNQNPPQQWSNSPQQYHPPQQ